MSTTMIYTQILRHKAGGAPQSAGSSMTNIARRTAHARPRYTANHTIDVLSIYMLARRNPPCAAADVQKRRVDLSCANMDIPLKDVATALATVTASLIAAFLGSMQGAKTALARFKKERGFDRRLTCYEDIAKQFGKAKLELEVAKTFQEDPNEPYEKKCRMWKRFQQEYIGLAALEPIAAIYAGRPVYENLVAVRVAFDEVADQTNGMDEKELYLNSGFAFPLIDVLYDASQTHSTEVRRELGFDDLELHAVEESENAARLKK